MEIKINIPKDFTGDYIVDKLKDWGTCLYMI
jgi:hypothetical protein